ncbi:MAG TPA: YigZ family protein [Rhodanobacteraceae bacterium]|nr:YigZ family protein [Rhodanobacteraceae bacterium]
MIPALSTLAAPAQYAQEVKKSRFLALAAPVTTPPEALAWLERVRTADATHNCWAYRIGQLYRFSDDGEPGGTAGRPILQAIDGQGCDRVMVVVTRWYGGTKLGAGGLVRAYGGCAAECLRTAAREPLVARRTVRVWLPFAALAPASARLAEFEAAQRAERFDAGGATLELELPPQRVEALRQWLADLSRGRATLQDVDADTG